MDYANLTQTIRIIRIEIDYIYEHDFGAAQKQIKRMYNKLFYVVEN